ncbi:uncharacterized protein LOC116203705 isoform X6 [Punica granatum]|uniref:Uncharacterized protein LOC116203705 isoform X6 n=1 Tax=Punica granatum TaxID=22663 RepID=A0A6P8DIU4_PUNGR|nr:uncharacterized protein LOC116203705 isoform X6 [Punica granatum]
MEEDSSRTRECKRTSVTYSSSSSSTAPSKRRKVSSPLGGDGDWDRDWEAFSSVSELASCTALLSTGSAGKAKVEVISPAAALLLRSGRLCPSSFCSDVPAVSPPPLSSFGSGEVVEQRFLVGDQLFQAFRFPLKTLASALRCLFSPLPSLLCPAAFLTSINQTHGGILNERLSLSEFFFFFFCVLTTSAPSVAINNTFTHGYIT